MEFDTVYRPTLYRQCRISNVANVAYATSIAIFFFWGESHEKISTALQNISTFGR